MAADSQSLLDLFHEKIDNSNYDARDSDKINRELQELNGALSEAGESELLHSSELERQAYSLNKSFSTDGETNKVKGVGWKVSGYKTLESGEEVPMIWPDISTFILSDYEYLEQRYKACKNLYTKIEFGMILYFQKPTLFSKHNDFKLNLCEELFEISQHYYKILLEGGKNGFVRAYFQNTLQGAFYIAIQSKLNEQRKKISAFLQQVHLEYDFSREDVIHVLFLMVDLLNRFFNDLKDDLDLDRIHNRNIELIEAKSDSEYWGITEFLKPASILDQKIGASGYSYLKTQARIYEGLANNAEDTDNQLAAIGFVERALRMYRLADDKEKVAELEAKYQSIRGSGKLGTIKSELDPEYVEERKKYIIQEIDDSSEEEILQILSLSPMYPDVETIHVAGEKSYEESFSLKHFGNSVVDKFGNTCARYNSEEERKEFAFWQVYGFYHQIGTQWLVYYFIEAVKRDKISKESVRAFFSNSWLNAPILRQYNGQVIEVRPFDLITPVTDLLFDQLSSWKGDPTSTVNTVVLLDSMTLKCESVLRYMCEWMGIPTFRTKDKGVVHEKNIDELFADLGHTDKRDTGFNERDRLHMKYVLSERTGHNLRNKVAHGLLDANEYGFDSVIQVFSVLLRFCRCSFEKSTHESR